VSSTALMFNVRHKSSNKVLLFILFDRSVFSPLSLKENNSLFQRQ
jgi:hypothetical protein